MSAIKVHFTIIDSKNRTSKTSINVPTGFSIAQYLEFGQSMGQLIAVLCDGQITEISVSYPLSLSGATIRAAAAAAADIFKKVFFQASSAVAGLVSKFFIPTYDEANTVASSDQVNMADAQVAAIVAIIEDGVNVSGEIVQPIDIRGNDLELVTIGREVFRKF